MAKVIIPTPLRKFTGNEASFNTNKQTVKEAIHELVEKYPEIKLNLLDERGDVRKFIKIFLGDNDINSLEREQTAVQENSVISIIPAIAGG